MNDFIPLFAQAGESAPAALNSPRLGFHSTANGEVPQPFRPISPPAAPAPAPASQGCAGSAAPEVTFQRNGDRITQIHIKCGCGQVIILDCEY